jgi:hypothetical protein
VTCPICSGVGQGRQCHACFNATRAAVGMAPRAMSDEERDEPLVTTENAERFAAFIWTSIFFLLAIAAFALIAGVEPSIPLT